MRAGNGAPGGRATAPERASRVRRAARRRAGRTARQAARALAREPREGYVGAAFLITAVPALAVLLARHGLVAHQRWLCQEVAVVLAAGAALFGAARLRTWRR